MIRPIRVSREEQLVLVVKAKAGDIKARDRLVLATMGFVYQKARRWAKRCTSFDVDDLVSEGVFGVMRAIQKFEEGRGFAFLTYAGGWIDSFMRRAITQRDRDMQANNGAQEKVNCGRLRREWVELERSGLSVEKVRSALGAKYGWRPETVEALERMTRGHTRSLDEPISTTSTGDTFTLQDRLADAGEPVDERLDRARSTDRFRKAVRAMSMSPRERLVLARRIFTDGDGETLQEVGERIGVSRERVRQIEEGLLWRMRKELAEFGGEVDMKKKIAKVGDRRNERRAEVQSAYLAYESVHGRAPSNRCLAALLGIGGKNAAMASKLISIEVCSLRRLGILSAATRGRRAAAS